MARSLGPVIKAESDSSNHDSRRVRSGSLVPAESTGTLPDDFTVSLISQREFASRVRHAVTHGVGYAAGKLGISEQHWMYYPFWPRDSADRRQRFAFDAAMRHHSRSSGIFPLTPETFDSFAEFYAVHVRRLDCVGIGVHAGARLTPLERNVLWHYQLPGDLISYTDQEPCRSIPDQPYHCYLPALAGKRVLLVCPFARLLQQRATQAVFEGVWSRTEKRWFAPASVEALEFPYGFDPATHARYSSVLSLFDDLASRMRQYEFDVALIAAAALGIPLASTAKEDGKVGISLGGHLQVLFGVAGKRWRDSQEWSERYFNEWWIDMPEQYKPAHSQVCDAGSYW
ncbi:MAG: hypothetical protein U0Q11_15400 [Vicinamibacterales bacterium]